MIKFFRKIRQRLLTENKFSKYLLYAIGEIVLVVIGILIALSINNWNEGRKDRLIEKSILLELGDNLERNIALIDIASAKFIEINKGTTTIIEIIEERKSYPDSLIYHFDKLNRSGSYLLKLNTDGYESLKNIGFEILTSKVLKKEILSLFEISYQSYIRETEVINAAWGSNPMWWQDYFYIRSSKPGLIPLDYSTLIGDRKFMTIVRELEAGRKKVFEQMILCREQTQKVLKLIKNELVKSNVE
jgi:sarcosine oxidase delta subunit